MFKFIWSEKGFGIIHVIAVLFITTLAISALWISTMFARSKANENYHYRAAILQAAERLELLKFYNLNKNGVEFTTGNGVNDAVVLDKRDGHQLWGTLTITKTTHSELAIAPYAGYDQLEAKITWEEPDIIEGFGNMGISNVKSIILREDYYRRLFQ